MRPRRARSIWSRRRSRRWSRCRRTSSLRRRKDLPGLYGANIRFPRQFREKSAAFVTATSDKIREMADTQQDVVVAGAISLFKKHFTKKNNEPMVFLTVEDLNGSIDVTAFPSVYRLQGC